MSGSRGSRDEAGETLVEVLVAIAILGLAAVAILAGVELSVKSSAIGRNQATGGSYVRSLGEAIQNEVNLHGYQKCGGSGYISSAVLKAAGIPTGSPAAAYPSPSVVKTWAWTASGWQPCTASADNGVQRLDLKVIMPGDASHTATEYLSVIVRRPCNDTWAPPC